VLLGVPVGPGDPFIAEAPAAATPSPEAPRVPATASAAVAGAPGPLRAIRPAPVTNARALPKPSVLAIPKNAAGPGAEPGGACGPTTGPPPPAPCPWGGITKLGLAPPAMLVFDGTEGPEAGAGPPPPPPPCDPPCDPPLEPLGGSPFMPQDAMTVPPTLIEPDLRPLGSVKFVGLSYAKA